MRLLPPDGPPDGLRLIAALRLDETALGYLLGHELLDLRLAACCSVFGARGRPARVQRAAVTGAPSVVYVQTGDLEAAWPPVARHAGVARCSALDVERALWSRRRLATRCSPLSSGARASATRRCSSARPTYCWTASTAGGSDSSCGERRAIARTSTLDGRGRWEPTNRSAGSVIALEPRRRLPAQAAACGRGRSNPEEARRDPAVIARLAATFPTLGAAQIAAAVLHAVRQGAGRAGSSAPATEAMLEGARASTAGRCAASPIVCRSGAGVGRVDVARRGAGPAPRDRAASHPPRHRDG